MAEPSVKSKEIRDMQSKLLGRDIEEAIKADVCARCGGPAKEFKNKRSETEFTISGFCQKCQDKVFG